ncbi:MAG: hypothetical protein AAF682_23745 [Planctomycetota bacterium]
MQVKRTPFAISALILAPATLLAGGTEGAHWHFTQKPTDAPAEEDEDDVGFFEPGSGSAEAKSYLDFKVRADVEGTEKKWSAGVPGSILLSQFQTDLDVETEWCGREVGHFHPDEKHPIGWAEFEYECEWSGELHVEDWPSSFAFSSTGVLSSTLLEQDVEVGRTDYGHFTQDSSFLASAKFGSGGLSGSVGVKASSGSFGGAFVPIHVLYEKQTEKGASNVECQNDYFVRADVDNRGHAEAGVGWFVPGELCFDVSGGVAWGNTCQLVCEDDG